LLEQIFNFKTAGLKGQHTAFPEREAREKPKGIPGVSRALFPRRIFYFWKGFFLKTTKSASKKFDFIPTAP